MITADDLDAEDVLLVVEDFQSLRAGCGRQPRFDVNFSNAADRQIALHHASADEGLVLVWLVESPHQ